MATDAVSRGKGSVSDRKADAVMRAVSGQNWPVSAVSRGLGLTAMCIPINLQQTKIAIKSQIPSQNAKKTIVCMNS